MAYRPVIPVPALLAMVAALLILSAGPALSGDFAGTLPIHAHVFLGNPHLPHSHDFDPSRASPGDVVNVSSNEAGVVALGVVSPPDDEAVNSVDATPWIHGQGGDAAMPEGVDEAPPARPPIS